MKRLCSVSLKKEESSSQIYFCDGAILELQNMAGNSVKLQCAALTLKYLEGLIEEPSGFTQASVAELNVRFVRVLGKVSRMT